MKTVAPESPAVERAVKVKSGPIHYGYVILLIAMISVTGAIGIARFGYTLILPSMRDGLGLNFAQMGLIASGNFLGYMLSALVCGVLATRFGTRFVISGGLILVGLMMLLTGMAQGLESALAARVFTGIGSAAANVSAMSLAVSWFDRSRRGMVSGLISAGSGIGLVITGQIVPWIVVSNPTDGWRLSWFWLGAMVLVIAVLAAIFLRGHPRDKGVAPLWAQSTDSGALVIPAGKPRGGLRDVYRTSGVWQLGLIFSTFGFAYIIYSTFFIAHLVKNGYSNVDAGSLWGMIGLFTLFSAVLWGAISDRIGRGRAFALIFGVMAVSFLLFGAGGSQSVYLTSAVLFGLAGWSVPAIMAAAVGDYVEERLVPAAFGLVVLIFGVGQMLGPTVAGAMADAQGSFSSAMYLAAGVALLGALGSTLLQAPKRQH